MGKQEILTISLSFYPSQEQKVRDLKNMINEVLSLYQKESEIEIEFEVAKRNHVIKDTKYTAIYD